MAWMVPIYLVWVLDRDLQNLNRVASLAVRFLPSTKHTLLMLFPIAFGDLRDQSSSRSLYQVRKIPKFAHAQFHLLNLLYSEPTGENLAIYFCTVLLRPFYWVLTTALTTRPNKKGELAIFRIGGYMTYFTESCGFGPGFPFCKLRPVLFLTRAQCS